MSSMNKLWSCSYLGASGWRWMLRSLTVLVVISSLGAVRTPVRLPTATGRGGSPRLEPAIVGGFPTTTSQVPWQVSLRVVLDDFPFGVGWHFCGGSLLASPASIHTGGGTYSGTTDSVLTAAHCISSGDLPVALDQGRVYAVAGAGTASESWHLVYGSWMHPGWTGKVTGGYDIGIYQLETPVVLGVARQPIALATNMGEEAVGRVLQTSGWGDIYAKDLFGCPSPPSFNPPDPPSELRLVDLTVVPDDACQLTGDTFSMATFICLKSDDKGGCQGDSGGPAVNRDVVPPVLVGVTSGGRGCGTNWGGLFSSVASVSSWVSEKVNDGQRGPFPIPDPVCGAHYERDQCNVVSCNEVEPQDCVQCDDQDPLTAIDLCLSVFSPDEAICVGLESVGPVEAVVRTDSCDHEAFIEKVVAGMRIVGETSFAANVNEADIEVCLRSENLVLSCSLDGQGGAVFVFNVRYQVSGFDSLQALNSLPSSDMYFRSVDTSRGGQFDPLVPSSSSSDSGTGNVSWIVSVIVASAMGLLVICVIVIALVYCLKKRGNNRGVPTGMHPQYFPGPVPQGNYYYP